MCLVNVLGLLGQRGMVTVEFAIGLVTLVTLVSALVGLVLLGVAQSGIQTVSSELAKYLSRGDDALGDACSNMLGGGIPSQNLQLKLA